MSRHEGDPRSIQSSTRILEPLVSEKGEFELVMNTITPSFKASRPSWASETSYSAKTLRDSFNDLVMDNAQFSNLYPVVSNDQFRTDNEEGTSNSRRDSAARPRLVSEDEFPSDHEDGWKRSPSGSSASRPRLVSERSLKFEELSEDCTKAEDNRGCGVNFEEMTMSCGSWDMNENGAWACSSCTFFNEDPLHLACAVCGANKDSQACTDGLQSSEEQNDSVGYVISQDSIEFAQEKVLKAKRQVSLNLEQKAIERKRLNELVDIQFEVMDEINQENVELEEARKMSLRSMQE